MDGTEGADDGVVLDDDVAGERGGVGEDAAVADVGVVADVDVGHDEAAVAERWSRRRRRRFRGRW